MDLERKIDLSKYNLKNIVEISAKENIGIETMEDEIYQYITDNDIDDSSRKINTYKHET